MIDIGGRRLHLIESGESGPPVIFESGISATCLNWTEVRTQVARFARACAYDRAWLGWSDPAKLAANHLEHRDELHALLEAAADFPRRTFWWGIPSAGCWCALTRPNIPNKSRAWFWWTRCRRANG
jgi:pimeloyl-ACP methyl ester carboxylesterase